MKNDFDIPDVHTLMHTGVKIGQQPSCDLWLPSDSLNVLDYKSLWQLTSLQEAEHTTPTISGRQLLITRRWHGSHIGGNMSPNNHYQMDR